ncbi:MAG: hypothetical protein MI923_19450 [Phycisphaerales bacterium]|nr:hypothetical protein [Phycisphaerales bacterium]
MNRTSKRHKTPSRVRFVVLFHTQKQGDHFDLMIDDGSLLATWKTRQAPETARDRELDCLRIGNHRRIYLDYEGPISGDRGDVTQHDAGQCLVEVQTESRWDVTFEGKRLNGHFTLEKAHRSNETWRLRFRSTRRPSG